MESCPCGGAWPAAPPAPGGCSGGAGTSGGPCSAVPASWARRPSQNASGCCWRMAAARARGCQPMARSASAPAASSA
eukprot:6136146-Lingulodinium_polyedra.AAC.1